MKLGIMLSEINQTRENKWCMITLIYLYKVPIVVKFVKTGNRTMVNRGKEEKGMGNYYLIGTEFQFEMMKKLY